MLRNIVLMFQNNPYLRGCLLATLVLIVPSLLAIVGLLILFLIYG